jgi:hypothetical protein
MRETEKMHRLFLAGCMLAAGCQNIQGPFRYFKPERVDDPWVSIEEQQRRGRDRLALPFDSGETAPRTRVEFPGPHGR